MSTFSKAPSTKRPHTSTSSSGLNKESPRIKPPTPRSGSSLSDVPQTLASNESSAESTSTSASTSASLSGSNSSLHAHFKTSHLQTSVHRSSSTSSLLPGPSHSSHSTPTFAQPLSRQTIGSTSTSQGSKLQKSGAKGSIGGSLHSSSLSSSSPSSASSLSSSATASRKPPVPSATNGLLSPTSAASAASKTKSASTTQQRQSLPHSASSLPSSSSSNHTHVSSPTNRSDEASTKHMRDEDPLLSDAERFLSQMSIVTQEQSPTAAFRTSWPWPGSDASLRGFHMGSQKALELPLGPGMDGALDPSAVDSFTAIHPSLAPILDALRSEFHASLEAARSALLEDLKSPDNVGKLEARFVQEMRSSYSSLRNDVEIQNQLISQEITRLREQLAFESHRAQEAEEGLSILRQEFYIFQRNVYSELERISIHTNLPMPPPHFHHEPHPQHYDESMAPQQMIHQDVGQSERDALPAQHGEGNPSTVYHDATTPIPRVDDGAKEPTSGPDGGLTDTLQQSRMKLQEEIAFLRSRLEEAVNASDPSKAANTGTGLRRISTLDNPAATRRSYDAPSSSFADIEDLRRRYEMEQRFDEMWQKPSGAAPNEDGSSGQKQSNISPEEDEYPDVWDDDEFTCPLVTFPAPITELLQKQPRQGVLKRRAEPLANSPLPANGASESKPTSGRHVKFCASAKTNDGQETEANRVPFGMFRAMFLGTGESADAVNPDQSDVQNQGAA
eukprot:TRINITY_DN2638_c0_g1_i1.p1 TRINITY_DN2638_c0_g1~~TRINITY_DN2638_c0_g1_i1.p1  ORF type:complete len:731 (-),score=153.05 TRINITY_DN2638_c0_g1_i1:668-2860(-)